MRIRIFIHEFETLSKHKDFANFTSLMHTRFLYFHYTYLIEERLLNRLDTQSVQLASQPASQPARRASVIAQSCTRRRKGQTILLYLHLDVARGDFFIPPIDRDDIEYFPLQNSYVVRRIYGMKFEREISLQNIFFSVKKSESVFLNIYNRDRLKFVRKSLQDSTTQVVSFVLNQA